MTYPKAPIQEAVFDIRVDKVQNIDINSYMSLVDDKLSDFPKAEKQIVVSGRLKFDKKKYDVTSDQKSKKVIGIVFTSENSNINIQFRKDGFTLNMLKPYSSWSGFSSLAYKYWKIYQDEIRPYKVSRIALRYINRLELPLENFNFGHYLKYMPKVPNVFKDEYTNFLLKTVSRCKDSGNPVILIRRMEKPNETHTPFIIDIDVYKDKSINFDDIQNEFDILRKNKNDIFESLITDKTRNLFY